jgi:outer membrane murein-binding lipoprotein Lpp
MNKIALTSILLTGIILASCSSSQKFSAPATEDKPLFSAINELNKHPENAKAKSDVQLYYPQSVKRHEDAIAVYRSGNSDAKWDKIIREFNALQHIYTSISATPALSGVIEPKTYLKELQDIKEEAADYFYSVALDVMKDNTRESYLEAYEILKRIKQYAGNYKDVSKLMNEAYELAIVKVVINPIRDNSIYFAGWGGSIQNDLRYNALDYQQSLVRELGGTNADIVAARFYTDFDLNRERIDPDWAVDVAWRNLDAQRSVPYQTTRNLSRQIKIGKDTSGKDVYKTVYATLHITQRTYTVRGDLDYKMADLRSNQNIDQGLISNEVRWTDTYASYSGDSKALSQSDWDLINSSRLNYSPSRGEVLNTLMKKMYPDLRRRIEQAAS